MPKRRKSRLTAPSFTQSPSSFDPKIAQSALMSQSYASSIPGSLSNGHVPAANAYHPALPNFSGFPGLGTFAASLPMNNPSQVPTLVQQPIFSQVPLSQASENADLEKLERLKREILDGQNPIYKAVPQPDFLESLYLGRSSQKNAIECKSIERIAETVASSEKLSSAGNQPDDKEENNYDRPNSNHDVTSASPIVQNSLPQKIANSSASGSPVRSGSMSQIDLKQMSTSQPLSPSDTPSAGLADPGLPLFANGSVEPGNKHNQTATAQELSNLLEKSAVQNLSERDDSKHDEAASSLPLNGPSYDGRESLLPVTKATVSPKGRESRESADLISRQYGSGFPDHDKEKDHEKAKSDDFLYEDQRSGDFSGDAQHTATTDVHTDELYSLDSKQTIQMSSGNQISEIRQEGTNVPNLTGVKLNEHASHPPTKQTSVSGNEDLSKRDSTVVDQALRFIPNSNPLLTTDKSLAKLSNDSHPRIAMPDTYFHSADHIPFRAHSSPVDDRNRLASNGSNNPVGMHYSPSVSIVEERFRGRATLEDRLGLRSSLEERISSPTSTPIDRKLHSQELQERISDRLSLEDRIGSSPIGTLDNYTHSTGTEVYPSTIHSLGGQSGLGEEKPALNSPSNAIHEGDVRSAIKQLGDSSTYVEGFPSRTSFYSGNENRPSLQANQHLLYDLASGTSTRRGDTGIEAFPRENRVDAPDNRIALSPSRQVTDRRYSDVDSTVHYTRPPFRGRGGTSANMRPRPSLDTREWRERGSYPPRRSDQTRPESYPPPEADRYRSSDPEPREWIPGNRNYRTQAAWDSRRSPPQVPAEERGGYVNREFDRRSSIPPPPRSWDREDTDSMARPPPGIYPPDRAGIGGYHTDFRSNARIRTRSPSPFQRNGGPVDDFRPAKRARDDDIYIDDRRAYMEYQQHRPTPSGMTSEYYDARAPYTQRQPQAPMTYSGLDRDPEPTYYSHRMPDMGPPFQDRSVYSRPERNERRFSIPPPRTA